MKKLITTIGLIIAFGAAGSASALKVKVTPTTGKTKPYCKPSECPGTVGSGVQADSAVPTKPTKPAAGKLGKVVPKFVGTIKAPIKTVTKPTKVPTSDGNFGSKSGNL